MERMSRLMIWISGTDTSSGKTVVTAGLTAAIKRQGKEVRAVKLVQTGCRKDENAAMSAPDVLVYEKVAPLTPAEALLSFEDACSPHLAAGLAGLEICSSSLMNDLERAMLEAEVTLVEAAGGPLCPLNGTESMADFFMVQPKSFKTKVVLVVANRLGCINQAMLSLEALRNRGLGPVGLVFTNPDPQPDYKRPDSSFLLEEAIRKENIRYISEVGGIECLAEIPHLPELAAGDGFSYKDGLEKTWGRLTDCLTAAASFLISENNELEE